MIVEHYVIDPEEVKDVTFGFTSDLLIEETFVLGDVIIEQALESGIPPEGTWTILNGAATLAGNIVTQSVLDILDENVYVLECRVETDSGRTLERSVRLIGRDE